ncbi:MAG: hypothetical protein WC722_01560, partial [Rhodospirillales bacterium]
MDATNQSWGFARILLLLSVVVPSVAVGGLERPSKVSISFVFGGSMKKGPDRSRDIVNAIIKGSERSFKEFQHLSGGDWLEHAPEYFLVVSAGNAIRNFQSTNLLFEGHVSNVRKSSRAIRHGRAAKGERRNGRFDIVLYRADDKPCGVVEIKSPIFCLSRSQIIPDMERLCHILSANRS